MITIMENIKAPGIVGKPCNNEKIAETMMIPFIGDMIYKILC